MRLALLIDVRPPLEENANAWIEDILARISRLSRRVRLTVSLNRFLLRRRPSAVAELRNVEIATTSSVNVPLPLLRPKTAQRLVERNTAAIDAPVQGLVPPLLCFDRSLLRLGYSWVAADEISRGGTLGRLPSDRRFVSDSTWIVFVDRLRSMQLAYGQFPYLGTLRDAVGDVTLVASMAAEALHASESLLEEMTDTCTISELDFPAEPVELVAGSPRTWPEDLAQGRPFPTWWNPEIRPLELVWNLIETALQDVNDEIEEAVDWPMLLYASCRPHWDPVRIFNDVDRLARIIGRNDLAREIRQSFRQFIDERRPLRLLNDYMRRHSDPQSHAIYGPHAVPAWGEGEFDTPLYPFENPAYVGNSAYPF